MKAADDAARELARTLRELATSKPHVAGVLRGLARAMPEAAAEVQAALDDPAAALAGVFAEHSARAAAELADADHVIASRLAKAFGRGVKRGMRRK